MTVRVSEQHLGDLRWIVLRGPADEAFRALGAAGRAQIREVLTDWPMMAQLRDHVAGPGARPLAAVRQASEAAFPRVWAELAAMADGAGVPAGDLALLNLRGDVGVFPATTGPAATGPAATGPAAGAGGGCSDLAWRRQRSFIAHNEDELEFFEGRGAMLTLLLDDLPPVAAYWKPGFVPSSTVTATADGLAWSIDHMPAAAPGAGAGRHFVARGLQRAVTTTGQAVTYLREHPSAGGFAYTIGDRSGRVVGVEASAGQYACHETGQEGPLMWHTNHGRYVAGAGSPAGGSSMIRGEVLESLEVPAGEPDTTWFTRVLAGAPPPGGVRADPGGGNPNATLCTFVVNLTDGEMTVLPRGAAPVTIGLDDLARGNTGGQRPGP
jgi:Acyl-coenzyme A:6-aminopenicillanic acid acyl-transferase